MGLCTFIFFNRSRKLSTFYFKHYITFRMGEAIRFIANILVSEKSKTESQNHSQRFGAHRIAFSLFSSVLESKTTQTQSWPQSQRQGQPEAASLGSDSSPGDIEELGTESPARRARSPGSGTRVWSRAHKETRGACTLVHTYGRGEWLSGSLAQAHTNALHPGFEALKGRLGE